MSEINKAKLNPDLIVGVGASAGGLSALRDFLSGIPAGSGLAIVIVQHLSPDFESHLGSLLAQYTTMDVVTAEDGCAVCADTVYVIPPNHYMVIHDKKLLLTECDKDSRVYQSIDHFFRSLAGEMRARAVSVILSGTGSDGSRGIREVASNGGLVMVQTVESAGHSGMIKSALATGCVDLVLEPKAMGEELQSRVRGKAFSQKKVVATLPPDIERLYSHLFEKFGVDFKNYKESTIRRRLQRRIEQCDLGELGPYVDLLETNEQELESLFRDLLVEVTEFFRDSDAFDSLQENVIDEIIEKKSDGESIRVAFMLIERLGIEKARERVQIFASDLHPGSIEYARAGYFETKALSGLSQKQRDSFFHKAGSKWQVREEVRRMIVFTRHNVLCDPPFTNTDMISCRNVLIYFEPVAQSRALSLFHFSLRMGGCLFLGPSETTGPLSDDFESLDSHWRIYRKLNEPKIKNVLGSPSFLQQNYSAVPSTGLSTDFGTSTIRPMQVYDSLLEQFIPPSILFNSDNSVLHVIGDVSDYVSLPKGRFTSNVLDCVIEQLRPAVSAASHQALRSGEKVAYGGIEIGAGDTTRVCSVRVIPFNVGGVPSETKLLLMFKEDSEKEDSTVDVSKTDFTEFQRANALESELKLSQQNLHSAMEEIHTANEELQTRNEELMTANEELQSSNEELHSVNEELHTVNSEYQLKITELSQRTEELSNFLENTPVGVLILDQAMRIQHFTKRMAEELKLQPVDVGRAFDDFAGRLGLSESMPELRKALAADQVYECEVGLENGRSAFLEAKPFTGESTTSGSVISILELTKIRSQQNELERYYRIVECAQEAIITKDLDGKIISWNKGAENLYGYEEKEVLGKHISLIVPGGDRTVIDEILSTLRMGKTIDKQLVERRKKSGECIWVNLTVSPFKNRNGEIVGAVAVAVDVTDLTRTLAELRAVDERMKVFLDATAEAIAVTDENGDCTFCNQTCAMMLGFKSVDEVVGRKVPAFIQSFSEASTGTDEVEAPVSLLSGIKKGRSLHGSDELLLRADGTYLEIEYWSRPVPTPEGGHGAVISFMDVSSRKEKERRERERVKSRYIRARIAEIMSDSVASSLALQFCAELLVKELGLFATAIWLVDDTNQNELELDSQAGRFAEMERFFGKVEVGKGAIGRIATEYQSVCLEDFGESFSEFTFPENVAEDLEVFFGFPLKVGKEFYGVLGLFCQETVRDELFIEFQSIATTLSENIQRKTTEAALRNSEEQIRLLLSSTAEGIYGIDLDGLCVFANEVCASMLGFRSVDEIIGKNMHQLVHHSHEDGASYSQVECPIFNAFRENRKVHVANEVFWRADGSAMPVEYWTNPVSKDGKVVGAVVTFLDTTERRETMKALELGEARLRSIIDSSMDAIVAIDTNSKIVRWNPRAEKVFGWTVAEAIGADLTTMIIPKEHRTAHRKGLKKLLKTGESKILNKALRLDAMKKDGSRVPVELTVTAGGVEGNLEFNASLRDISDRVEAEAKLLEAKRLADEANRAKGDFLANMSHEIRTPMTAILGYADLLSNHLDDPDNLACVQTIKRNGEFLVSILNDILDFSKIEAGKLEIASEKASLPDIIGDLYSLLSIRATEQGLDFNLEFVSDLPRFLVTDGRRLRQILVNLVGNALKFTEEGSVTLEVKYVSETKGSPNLEFAVIDTGIGIPESRLESIFDSFTQVDTSSKRQHEGSGLGLAICKRLVEMLGGELSATCVLDVGSRFSFTVPVLETTEVELIAPENFLKFVRIEQSEESRIELDIRVLIVDDRDDIRFLVEQYLRRAGVSCETAENGLTALEAVKDAEEKGTAFDAIVMDMQMPVMDGFSATSELRKRNYDGKIIALTAGVLQKDRERCFESGCDAHLTKPVDRFALLRKLEEYFGAVHSAEPEQTVSQESNAISILIVEDNKDAREITKTLLELEGYEVHTAEDGNQAIEKNEKTKLDVVLMDLGLPDMDGFNLLDRLKQSDANPQASYAVLSGRVSNEDTAKSLDAGFDAFLCKPLDMDQLRSFLTSRPNKGL